MMQLVYVGFSFKHHKNTQAGYNNIQHYLKYDTIIDSQKEHEFLSYKAENWLIDIIRKMYRVFLGRGHTLTMLKCIYRALFYKNQVFHFIYAENTYKWLHCFRGKTNKIVSTYHQPFELLKTNSRWVSDIKKVNAVILMSNNDVEPISNLRTSQGVFYIPHGINTCFYKPNKAIERCHNIIMVGNWLRDFEFADQVFQKILSVDSLVTITIVTAKQNYKFFTPNPRIELFSGITDIELLNLYLKTKCLFLPLKTYTANNAVLEASASGCPIVIATNNPDYSYFNEMQSTFLPLQADLVVEYILKIIQNDYDERKALKLRKYVVDNYSWEVIAQKTKDILLSI